MKKIEAKKEQKQRIIIETATNKFLKEGYQRTSMDSLAQEAGVTKQTIYRYFESKEALFKAVLESMRSPEDTHFQKELNRESPYEALFYFAIGFLEFHMSEAHLASIRLLVAEGRFAPEMTRVFFSVGPSNTEPRLRKFFETRLPSDDPEYAVKMFLSTLLSMRMNVLVGLRSTPTREELEDHARRTVAFCVKNCGCD